jgi:hypothetical protein
VCTERQRLLHLLGDVALARMGLAAGRGDAATCDLATWRRGDLASGQLSEPGNSVNRRPAAADRRGIGFGWLQNGWLLHARLKIHRGVDPGLWPTQKTRGPVHVRDESRYLAS